MGNEMDSAFNNLGEQVSDPFQSRLFVAGKESMGAFHSTKYPGKFHVTNGTVFSISGHHVPSFARKYETNEKKTSGRVFAFLSIFPCFGVAR